MEQAEITPFSFDKYVTFCKFFMCVHHAGNSVNAVNSVNMVNIN